MILIGEIVGGILSDSLALLADAGHVLTDIGALLVSIIVAYLVKTGGNEHRIRTLGGIVNALLLAGVAVWIFVEALDRLQNPRDVISWIMISVAILGTIGNYVQHRVLEIAEENHVTHEAMSLHILSDLVQSIVVVFGGIVIAVTGWHLVDPILSFGIAVLMGYWSMRLLWKMWSGKYDHHSHKLHHHH